MLSKETIQNLLVLLSRRETALHAGELDALAKAKEELKKALEECDGGES